MLTKLKEFDEMFCSFDERFRQAFDALTHMRGIYGSAVSVARSRRCLPD